MAEQITMTGGEQVMQRLHELGTLLLPLAGIALQQEGDAILEASQPLVPVLTGAMKASGTVEGPFLTATSAEVDIRYGDHGRLPYTARQHEDVTLNHPRVGQAHFLSEPVLAATEGMLERLADALRLGI